MEMAVILVGCILLSFLWYATDRLVYHPLPKYKIGDELYYSATEFPDSESCIVITAIGENEYQYKFLNSLTNKKYTSPIWYVNSKFSLLPGSNYANNKTW